MDSELHEINITPFTDVLLVLLVIFMILAALTLPPGFERELPSCSCSPLVPAKPSHDISVVVERSGEIRVDGRHADTRSIYGVLASAAAHAPRAGVQLYGSAGAPYGTIMRVLDAAKDAGIANLSFVTQ